MECASCTNLWSFLYVDVFAQVFVALDDLSDYWTTTMWRKSRMVPLMACLPSDTCECHTFKLYYVEQSFAQHTSQTQILYSDMTHHTCVKMWQSISFLESSNSACYIPVVYLLCDHPFCQAEAVTWEGWSLIRGAVILNVRPIVLDFVSLITGGIAQQRGHITWGPSLYLCVRTHIV